MGMDDREGGEMDMKHTKLPLDSMEAFNNETFRRATCYMILVDALKGAMNTLNGGGVALVEVNMTKPGDNFIKAAQRAQAALDACEVG